MSFGKGDGIPWKNLDVIDANLPTNVRRAAILECIAVVEKGTLMGKAFDCPAAGCSVALDIIEALQALLGGEA